jgi:hypothetical protein
MENYRNQVIFIFLFFKNNFKLINKKNYKKSQSIHQFTGNREKFQIIKIIIFYNLIIKKIII